MTVLGIETSCDETAAAVVRGCPPGPGAILSNVVLSQLEAHRPFGGVVPEIAARAHVEALDSIITQALQEAGLRADDLDGVAAAAGPGLIGGVIVGLSTAKAIALGATKPLVAVNHLEAHALSARLSDGIAFPFLLLLISGGHCQLLAVEGVGKFRLYGATIDDAIGEAFDKTAKLMGLPYPGGPEIEILAREGDATRYALPRPMVGRDGCDFSFSGIKTAVRQLVLKTKMDRRARHDLAASFQSAIRDILADRVKAALERFTREFPQVEEGRLVAAGGVAANTAIRHTLAEAAAAKEFSLIVAPPELCTDNGAMIAWAGVERLALGLTDDLDCPPRARWPLDESRPAETGAVPAGLALRATVHTR
ncbi:MAG: tRNA (adenosine(37)-N6)-threonylcarbamoyltransferase complex transferase subunit TsaD [Alphaproteobacteria bacterium]